MQSDASLYVMGMYCSRRQCLSDGGTRYYEWQTKGKSKLPYFIRHADPTKKLYFAGLWDMGKTSSEGKQTNRTQHICFLLSIQIALLSTRSAS
jgi:putative SOS response-associated peptidase YedK